MDLSKYIRKFEDFPKKGVIYRDMSPLLMDPKAWSETLMRMKDSCKDNLPDLIAGIESRGFIVGASLAASLGVGFIPIRKSGKLAGDVIGENYKLEYGVDKLEISKHSLVNKQKVLIVDDLLATGGTAQAAGKLVTRAGGNLIGYSWIIELVNLKGRDKLSNKVTINSLIQF